MVRRIAYYSLAIVGSLSVASLLGVWMLSPPNISVPPSADRMITNVNIWNPGEPLKLDRTIVVKNGLITEIRPSRTGDDPPICKNCFVMPGLIDAHVHTPPQLAFGNQRLFSLLYLKYGVTTVRDLGQIDGSVATLQSDIASGKIVGPRMYRCGPVLDGDKPNWPSALRVLDGMQAVTKVKSLKASGVSCIKTYTRLPKTAFEGAAAEAARQGLPLIGHTPHAVNLRNVSDFEIQHFNGIPYLHKAPPENADYRSEDVSAMSEADVAEVIALMKTNSMSILPTQANGRARLTASDYKRFPPTEGTKHLPRGWEKAWPIIVSHPETTDAITADLAGISAELAFVGKAQLAGIDVLAGTDVVMPYVVPGESLHIELRLLSDAFGSEEAALAAATQVNGRHVDQGRIGRIAAGNFADLLVFREDPRIDLASVKDWTFLMVDGRMYGRGQIDAAVDKYDQHFRGAFYEAATSYLIGILASNYGHTSNK